MWYRIPINICENTEIARKSKIIENYLSAIDISAYLDKKSFENYYLKVKKEIKNNEPKELKEFHEFVLIKGENIGYWKIITIIKNTVEKNLFKFERAKNLTLYSDMDIFDEARNIVKNFCDFIWKNYYSKKDKDDYVTKYIDEVSPNKKCMCCGISSLSDGEYDTVRSDIDHWFPKNKYPFVSFYKQNLFIICSSCNKKKATKVMDDYVINPHLEKDFELKINSISMNDNEINLKVDFEIEPKFLASDYINVWEYLFNIKCLLKKEFKEKIEDYELIYKNHTLENLKELVDKLRFRKEIIQIAYLNYKIKNYDRTQ